MAIGLVGKLVGGAIAGLLGVFMIKWALQKGRAAESRAANLENEIKSQAEAKRQEREAQEAAENAKKDAGVNPTDW